MWAGLKLEGRCFVGFFFFEQVQVIMSSYLLFNLKTVNNIRVTRNMRTIILFKMLFDFFYISPVLDQTPKLYPASLRRRLK